MSLDFHPGFLVTLACLSCLALRYSGHSTDFIPLFRSEYEEKDSETFDNLVSRLRATEEWGYVDRKVDIRLMKP